MQRGYLVGKRGDRQRAFNFAHLSPKKNRLSIQRLGLLPCRDKRGNGRVWLCTPCALKWALLHVSKKHNVNPLDLDLWVVSLNQELAYRKRRGVYFTHVRVSPYSMERLDLDAIHAA